MLQLPWTFFKVLLWWRHAHKIPRLSPLHLLYERWHFSVSLCLNLVTMAVLILQCSFCPFKTRFFHLFCRHSTEHENIPNFKIMCPIETCCNGYKYVGSFRKHFSRKHKSNMSADKVMKESKEICLLPETPAELSFQSSVSQLASDWLQCTY